MTLPRGLRAVRGVGGALAFAAPEVEAWVRGALGRGEGLYEAATRDAATTLHGRGPVPVVATPRGSWVVRRYRRGGRVAAPLLGDRYLRLGIARPVREARASDEARRRGLATPRVLAGAVYPAGAFYRADLVTEFVPDAVELARLLFTEERDPAEREEALAGVGRLIARAAAVGVEHRDLNARNVLIERHAGGTLPLLLDLDRCRVCPAGTSVRPDTMRARLERSLRKHERASGRPLAAAEWAALARAAAGPGAA